MDNEHMNFVIVRVESCKLSNCFFVTICQVEILLPAQPGLLSLLCLPTDRI